MATGGRRRESRFPRSLAAFGVMQRVRLESFFMAGPVTSGNSAAISPDGRSTSRTRRRIARRRGSARAFRTAPSSTSVYKPTLSKGATTRSYPDCCTCPHPIASIGFPGTAERMKMRIDRLEPGRVVEWACEGDYRGWAGTRLTWELRPTPKLARQVSCFAKAASATTTATSSTPT
jgi:hypothetical protein